MTILLAVSWITFIWYGNGKWIVTSKTFVSGAAAASNSSSVASVTDYNFAKKKSHFDSLDFIASHPERIK